MTNEYSIVEWAQELGIYEKSDLKTQYIKMVEEVGEVGECITKSKSPEEIELELGDVAVTLINTCHMAGTTMGKALDAAYAKIKDRTGKMQNGSFVKSGD